MTTNRRQVLIGATAASVAFAAPLRVRAAGAVTDPKLAALLDAFVDEILTDNPETATSKGLDKGALAGLKSRLSDASDAGRKRIVASYSDRRKRLAAIDRKSLTPRDATLYDTVNYAQGLGEGGGRFAYGGDGAQPYVVSQQDGAVSYVPEFLNSQHGVTDKSDADAYLARLEAFGAVLDQETDLTSSWPPRCSR